MNNNVLKKIFYFIFSILIASIGFLLFRKKFIKSDILLIPMVGIIIFFILKPDDNKENFAAGTEVGGLFGFTDTAFVPAVGGALGGTTTTTTNNAADNIQVISDLVNFPAEQTFNPEQYLANTFNVQSDTDFQSLDQYFKQQSDKKTQARTYYLNTKSQEVSKLNDYNTSKNTNQPITTQNKLYAEYVTLKNRRIFQEEEESYFNNLVNIANEKLEAARNKARDYFDAKKKEDDLETDKKNATERVRIETIDKNNFATIESSQKTILDAARISKEGAENNVINKQNEINNLNNIINNPNSSQSDIELAQQNKISKTTELNSLISIKDKRISNFNNASKAYDTAKNKYDSAVTALQEAENALQLINNNYNNIKNDANNKRIAAANALVAAKDAALKKEQAQANLFAAYKLNNRIKSLEDSKALSDAQAALDIKTLNDSLSAANTEKESLKTQLQTANTNLAAKDTELNTAKANITKLEGEKTAAQTKANNDIAAANAAKVTAEEKLKELTKAQTDLAIANASKATADAQIATLQKQIDYYNTTFLERFIAAETEARSSTALKNTAEANVRVLQAQLDQLQGVVASKSNLNEIEINANITKLNTDLAAATKARDEAQKTLTEKMILYAEAVQAKTNADKEIEKLTKEKTAALEAATKAQTEAEQKYNLLKSQSDAANEKVKLLEKEKEDSIKKVQELTLKMEDEVKKVQKLSEEKAALEIQVTNLTQNKIVNEALIAKLNSEKIIANKRIQILEEEMNIAKRKEQISALEKATSEKKIADLLKQISDQKKQAETNLARLQAERDKLEVERNIYEQKSNLLIGQDDYLLESAKLKNQKLAAEKKALLLSQQIEDAQKAVQLAKDEASNKDKQIAALMAEKTAVEKALQLAKNSKAEAETERDTAKKRIGELQIAVENAFKNKENLNKTEQLVNTQQNLLNDIKQAQNQPNISEDEMTRLKERQRKIEDMLIRKTQEFDDLQKKVELDNKNSDALQNQLNDAMKRADEAEKKLLISKNIQENANKIIEEKNKTKPEELMIIQEDILRPRKMISGDKLDKAVYLSNGEISPQTSENLVKNIIQNSFPFKPGENLTKEEIDLINSLVDQYVPAVQEAVKNNYNSTITNIVKEKVLMEEPVRIGLAKKPKLDDRLIQEKILESTRCAVPKYEEELAMKLMRENEILKEKVKKVHPQSRDLYDFGQQPEQSRFFEQEKNIFQQQNTLLEQERNQYLSDLERVERENEILKQRFDEYKSNFDGVNLNISVNENGSSRDINFEGDSIMNQRNNDLTEYFFNQYSLQ